MSSSSSTNASAAAAAAASADVNMSPTIDDAEINKTLDYYFDSYSHFGIHEEMLKDSVRTRAYMNAIVKNGHLFKDKVVLDVGCGTGILCMFAAKAGAKHVYGVDMAGIVTQARQIVKDNGFENQITIIRGKVEEIELPVKQVDIIISEWMGYFLIYESMLDTVLVARDRWLVPGGHIFPDRASIHLCAIEDAEYRDEKINFWDNVYGFDMSCIKELALAEPLVDVCESKQVITDSCRVLDVDIRTVKKEDLDFSSAFELKFKRKDHVHAIVAYFDIDFSVTHTQIHFSTGPFHEYTHWKQTVFYLTTPVAVSPKNVLRGQIKCSRNEKNPRDIDIVLTTEIPGVQAKTTKEYRLR